MALLTDDFESCDLTLLWSGNFSYHSCSSDQPHGGTYSHKGWTTLTGYAIYMIYRDFTATQKITVDYWDRWNNLNGGNHFYITDGTNAIVALMVRTDVDAGGLLYHNNGAWHSVPSFSPSADTYYHITLVIKGDTKKFDLYIDGVQKLTDVDWSNTGAGNPSRVQFYVQKGSIQSRYYRDDLNIEEMVEAKPSSPSIASLMRLMDLI